MRSFLAVLGILVGTASVVANVSSTQMATQHALKQFKVLGTGLMSFSINPNDAAAGKSLRRFSAKDAMVIRKHVPEILHEAPYTSEYLSIRYMGHMLNGIVIGSTASLQDVIKIKMAKGRFVSDLDGYNPFCTVGAKLARQMRKFSDHIIGTQIQLGNVIYTVVGIAKTWPANSFFYQNINAAVIVPIKASRLLSKYTKINNIVFYLKPNVDIDSVQAKIKKQLESLLPGMNLFPRSAKQIIESMEKQRQTLNWMMDFIGSISLFVGGIGVMNIMLVSVVERKREIGIRKALGATRYDIRVLFLIESIVLSFFGGIMGVIFGVLASYIISTFAHWDFHVYFLPPFVGFVVSVLVGIISGVYPAFLASKLDPIDCLRTE